MSTTTSTSTPPPTAPARPGAAPASRRTAALAGALYLLTFASSIPALAVLDPVLSDPRYVLGTGADTRVALGCLLLLVNAFACVGTAVVLHPVLQRHGSTLALGFVASRVLEAAIVVAGALCLLAVVQLRGEAGGADAADPQGLASAAAALVAGYDVSFQLVPVMAVANALLLGTLVHRSRLVPRAVPLLGLVGAAPLLAASTATVLGVNDQFSALSLLALPGVFLWELSLGLHLLVRGFRPSPAAAGQRSDPAPAAV
ncbi:DUF4386 family protein [Kineococcus sp. T13]|uniref:DUF4386 domain-containing protein n=1 Tax=Kineococcus vitellinus TaxID=2696565 RepID=UPI00141258CD|nr:DUF4386 domain-containing protein [Kineococcus vitellinus]NAZ76613.1 DUF4386 family protein [Kineococcus vitellinus]